MVISTIGVMTALFALGATFMCNDTFNTFDIRPLVVFPNALCLN